ncbi:MAG: hypothetical protein EOP83_30405 [Verrucomicrobiaceae bacterium]|nr:MAG: hypothetical protein EOP83_30405 [Verrucomicrobiaceae bacterium]
MAIGGTSPDERISALNRADVVLKANNMTVDQLLTGDGTAIQRLEVFDNFQQTISTLEERVAQLENENAFYRENDSTLRSKAIAAGIFTNRWPEFYRIAVNRFAQDDGTVPKRWRRLAAQKFGVSVKRLHRWQHEIEEIPLSIMEALAAMPVIETGHPTEDPARNGQLVPGDEFLSPDIDIEGEFASAERQGRRRLRWEPLEMARLRELVQMGLPVRQIADRMSRDFKRPFTRAACNGQIQRLNLREGSTDAEPPEPEQPIDLSVVRKVFND